MSSDLPSPPQGEGRSSGKLPGEQTFPRWTLWLLLALVIPFVFLSLAKPQNTKDVSYGDFMEQLKANNVKAGAEFNNATGQITGEFNDGTKFSSNGPTQPTEDDLRWMTDKNVKFTSPDTNGWASLIIYLLPLVFFVGFLIWIQ